MISCLPSYAPNAVATGASSAIRFSFSISSLNPTTFVATLHLDFYVLDSTVLVDAELNELRLLRVGRAPGVEPRQPNTRVKIRSPRRQHRRVKHQQWVAGRLVGTVAALRGSRAVLLSAVERRHGPDRDFAEVIRRRGPEGHHADLLQLRP